MSEAGRRRPSSIRPATRFGARTTAALTALTLAAAVAVPAAIMTGGPPEERVVRGAAAGALAGAPTDQIRARAWHLQTLRVARAWQYSKGRGVTVAVLDTGVDQNHPDLTGQVITGPDLTGGVRRPGTRYWGLHGTSMASIISAHGHGPGLSQGMMGIAPQSHILSIRVTLENDDPLRRDNNGQQNGDGDRDAVAQGIRYAVDHGAEIINMSLGGGRQFYNGTKAQEDAIKYALGKGVVLIASAGNDGSGANRRNYPAAYPGVIAVGALDQRLRLWADSNRRSQAAVCAPGVDIVSADASSGYVVGTGTSASSAMVAGVAALVRSRYPRLTPAEVRQALIQGSPPRRGSPTGSSTCRGTVDALRTLYAAHQINKTSSGPVETPSPTPTPEPVAEEAPAEGSDLLFPLVLGGGGLLVVLGMVLGWRQRRTPEEDDEDTEALPDYGLPPEPSRARRPVPAGAPAGGGGAVPEPVNAPLWQSTDVYQGPPAAAAPQGPPGPWPPVPARGSPGSAEPPDGAPAGGRPAGDSPWDAPSVDVSSGGPGAWGAPPASGSVPGDSPWDGSPAGVPPVDGPADGVQVWGRPPEGGSSAGDLPWDGLPVDRPAGGVQPWSESPAGDSPWQEPPGGRHDLRPFVPGEYSGPGWNGQDATDGGEPPNGHDLGNGRYADEPNEPNGPNGANGSDAGESFGLDDEEWEAFRRSALAGADQPEPADPSPPPLPADDMPTGALPAVPPSGLFRPADREPPRGPVPPVDRLDDEVGGRPPQHPPRPPGDDDYRPPAW